MLCACSLLRSYRLPVVTPNIADALGLATTDLLFLFPSLFLRPLVRDRRKLRRAAAVHWKSFARIGYISNEKHLRFRVIRVQERKEARFDGSLTEKKCEL